MSDELTVFEPIKPVGKCGACGRELYPHSSPNICDYRQDCPMHGERWMAYKMSLQMRNTRIGVGQTVKHNLDTSQNWKL